MLPRNTGHGPKPKCLAATPAVLFVCIWMSANVWIGIVLQTFDYSISTATWSIDVITFSSKVKEKEEIKDESMYGFRRYNGGKMISLNSEDLKHVVIQRGHLSHQNINHSSSFYLPEALRPIQTFNASPKHRLIPKDNRTINDIFIEENCCQMALDKMNNKKISQDNYCWQAICHTPRACNDSLYPFSSQHEKDYFQLRKLQRKEKKKFKRQCDSRNGMLVPPYTWCKQWFEHDKDESTVSLNHTKIVRGSDRVTIESVLEESSHQNLQMLEHYNYKNINPYEAKLPPPGCSHFTEGGGSGSYVNLFLFPQAKLAFCGIYKGGNTQWRQFLRFTLGAKDYQANPHSKRDQHLFSFDLMREEIQTEILNDPEWKFAVFLRDPAERLLSAYLDKMGRRVNTTEVEHYRKVFNFTETPSFAEFLETIAMNRTKCPGDKGSRRDNLFGVDWCSDIHWRPQTMACGISEFLPRISYIGSLDRVASQTRAILSKVNLWESYGKYFHWDWKRSNFSGSDESTVCATPPPQLNVGDRLIGFQQKVMTSQPKILRHGANHHATGSQSKIDEFYTPRLRQMVREIYRKDYELWDLVRNRDEIMSGSELAMMVSGDCQRAATRLVRDGELKSFTA